MLPLGEERNGFDQAQAGPVSVQGSDNGRIRCAGGQADRYRNGDRDSQMPQAAGSYDQFLLQKNSVPSLATKRPACNYLYLLYLCLFIDELTFLFYSPPQP